MATTQRKRSTGQKSPRTDRTAAEPAGPVTDAAATTDATDPSVTLTATYWRALDDSDEATGTIPAEQLDAVRKAYLSVPKRNQQRGDLATRLNAEALQRMVESGNVAPGRLQAIQALSALFAEANASSGQAPTAAPHDPVPGVAGLLTALDHARESILAELTDDQRERLADVDPSDAEAQDASDRTVECLAKIGTRVLNGRKRKPPTRSGKNLGEVIRDAVENNPGRPLDLATIAKIGGVKASGLWSRWTANKTAGVQAVEDDNGRKAFIAA
jgi:hypothetical protein